MSDETLDRSPRPPGPSRGARPGVIATFSGSAACWIPLPLARGTLLLGRAAVPLDPRLSREHALITRTAEGWRLRDLGSRNGTFVDGHPVNGEALVASPRVIRLADSIFLPVDDLDRWAAPTAARDTAVGPPLRGRRDAIAHHVADEIAKASLDVTAHATLVEACLLRPWPGDVQELRRELQQAAALAMAEGSVRVRGEHLAASAGLDSGAQPAPTPEDPAPATEARQKRRYVRWSTSMTRERIERALAENDGSMAAAARSLGMNRSQLYREISRHSLGVGDRR